MVDQSTADSIVFAFPEHWPDDARRMLRDQASRLDERAQGVVADRQALTIRFSSTLDQMQKAQFLAALQSLAQHMERSFSKVRAQLVASHPGRPTFDQDPLP